MNIFALILIILGSFGFKKNKYKFLGLLVIVMIIFFSNSLPINNYQNLIFETESAYQYINVRQDNVGTKYLAVNESAGIQSIYNSDRVLTGFYYDYFNVLPDIIGAKKVLIIGLCGGTIAKQLNYYYPGELEIDGVEIDPKVIAVAKEYFALDPADVKIYNSDGRMFLQNNQTQYDLIIIDAYAQEFYIPWTLTTKEFWGLVEKSLKPGGMMAINVNSVTPDSRLLKAIGNTIAGVFPNTYITPIKNGAMNYIISASNQPVDFSSVTRMPDLALEFSGNTEMVQYDSNDMVLIDDRAPVEFLTDSMALSYLKR